ncbi:MAG TPA: hypothetical protein VM284_01040 [Candidatus Limnocylindria bacterium]|nr:hypothetical protein [Candidatus Limnocylindria bacterium]
MAESRNETKPAVLIVGGFATVPLNYWPLRRRLLERGAARVDIAPVWTPDWVLGALLGFGSVMLRTGRAIGKTWKAGGRTPIIVVGHSAGGIAARLALADRPFNDHIADVSEAVGCLVTLGTPHGLDDLTNRYRHAGHAATSFLNQATPGAYFAPRTSYLSVGGRTPRAAFPGLLGDLANEAFGVAVGKETHALGDGIVPFAAVHLEGATQLTYDDVRHGMVGGPWYGDEVMLDRWWPVALELWHAALKARSNAPAAADLPVLA